MRRRDAVVVALCVGAVGAAWLWLVRGREPRAAWPGVDEAVVEHFAEASGGHARPLVDWVQGDLLLFAFLVAGLLAGFVLGFFARGLVRGDREAS